MLFLLLTSLETVSLLTIPCEIQLINLESRTTENLKFLWTFVIFITFHLTFCFLSLILFYISLLCNISYLWYLGFVIDCQLWLKGNNLRMIRIHLLIETLKKIRKYCHQTLTRAMITETSTPFTSKSSYHLGLKSAGIFLVYLDITMVKDGLVHVWLCKHWWIVYKFAKELWNFTPKNKIINHY